MPIITSDFEQSKNPTLYKELVEVMHATSPVLDFLPFVDVNNNVFKYNLESVLPGIAYRDFNESYAESVGVINPKVETLSIFGGDSDFDVKMQGEQGGFDQRRAQDRMKAKAQAMFFTNEFFNGDSTADSKAIDGLKVRLTGDQVLDAGSTTDGDELTLDMLDELIVTVDGQKPNVLFMNMKMYLKVNRLMRNTTRATEPVSGSFGRLYPTYADIPMAVIESFTMKDSDGNTVTIDPLGFNEPDCNDAGTACTSISAVKFGKYEYVCGLQNKAFDVKSWDELPGQTYGRTKLDWMAGLAIFHPKSAARLRGIKNA